MDDETIEIENPQNGNIEDLISEYITGNYSFKDLSNRFNKESYPHFFLNHVIFHMDESDFGSGPDFWSEICLSCP